MEKTKPISIEGIIIASEWEPNGEIKAVDIAGYDETRYRIVDDHVGRKLNDLIQKKVIVSGFVDITKVRPNIQIHTFRIDCSDSIPADAHDNNHPMKDSRPLKKGSIPP
jgi:hypothetical protein